jgi:hypothetical protein
MIQWTQLKHLWRYNMSKKLNDYEWEVRKDTGTVSLTTKNLDFVKDLLNTTGCGFCLAKFTQVTLHLGTGLVHSCHHPKTHKISAADVEKNPNLLFNTPVLKAARKQMLTNEKPAECDYCWRIESNKNTSDRHFKSIEPWALSYHDKISEFTGEEDIYPTYLEVDFSNVCNLKCTYCGPEYSSKWVEDLKAKGPIKLLEGTGEENWAQGWQDLNNLTYKNREHNPYVTAFWKWWPEAYKHLKHYRITGGEPLMSKETFRSMDWFIDNPNPELEFSINTNLCVPDKLWDEFIKRLMILKDGTKIKRITIYTSAEGWGPAAEYGRTGMNFNLFKKRYEQLVALGNVRCVIMAAFNIFSITTFQKLLEWVLELKKQYNPNGTGASVEKDTGFNLTKDTYIARKKHNPELESSYIVGIDVPYLRHPTFLDAQLCSHDMVEKYLIPCLDFMATNSAWDSWGDHQGFEQHEIEKFRRIIFHRLFFNKKNDDRDNEDFIIKERAMFYDFVNTLDSRNSTSFIETFPEMSDYYELCKTAKDKHVKKNE